LSTRLFDGETGFEKATTLPFDLIVLDIMLPGRNGLDLCRDIRIAGLGTPISCSPPRGNVGQDCRPQARRADDYGHQTLRHAGADGPHRSIAAPARRFVLARPSNQFGSIRIETRARSITATLKVTRGGEPIYLSVREFELLRYFVDTPAS